MKTLKNIFIKSFIVLTVLFGVPAIANDNGCDDVNNDAIVAELALCSTHAYNINEERNPTGANKDLMRDVIAMKTTLITQQMYKQYEQMESMIRRLKTQLEKAVLTTNLEAKGASSSSNSNSSSSGSYKSENRNIYMAGVSDCNNELSTIKVFECLNNNLTTIYNTSNNGSNVTVELRKQLAKDFEVAFNNHGGLSKEIELENGEKVNCTKYNELGNKKKFQACLDKLRANVRKGYEAAQESQRKYQKQ